ncbi:MAG: hypothetical protein H6625_00085 [Bdellovibrionaceae bacterium]|nr:hypothetical protein [Pseudobdellovibrionaceae bacterium]
MYLKYDFVKLLLVTLWGLQSACSVGLMSVRSTPEGADVFLVQSGAQPVKIGVTPLNIPSDRINNTSGESVRIYVRKEGFKQESFLIPRVLFNSTIDLSILMDEDKLPAACSNQAQAVENLSRGIAEAQFLIQSKQYSQAENLINSLIIQNSNISVLWDLLGNLYYLKKDTEAALIAYEKSESLSPGQVHTLRMINKLRSIRSLRTPAGGG